MSQVTDPIQCRHCNKVFCVTFDTDDYVAWKKGELIQNAFPYLSADERELIKTQTCGNCWNKMFDFE